MISWVRNMEHDVMRLLLPLGQVTNYWCHPAFAVSLCPSCGGVLWNLRLSFLFIYIFILFIAATDNSCYCHDAAHSSLSNSPSLTAKSNEHILFPVAFRLQRNPTALRRSREVSQRANMAVKGGDRTTPSQTAPQSQRVTQSQRANLQSPSHSKPQQRSKTSQLERRSAWLMWRR